MHRCLRSLAGLGRVVLPRPNRFVTSAAFGKHFKPSTSSVLYGFLGASCAIAMATIVESEEGVTSPNNVDNSSVESAVIVKTDKIAALRPKDKRFQRIDEKVLQDILPEFAKNHALHDSLRGDSLIETFEVYHNPETSEIHCVVHFGNSLNGHRGVVHGGIIALSFDESFGWLFAFGLKTPMAFTANLNVNFRKKLAEDTTVAIISKLQERKDRKLLMEGRMIDGEGNLLAEATTLFIIARQDQSK